MTEFRLSLGRGCLRFSTASSMVTPSLQKLRPRLVVQCHGACQ